MSHLIHVLGVVFATTFATILMGVGAHLEPGGFPLVMALFIVATTTGITVVSGVFLLVWIRGLLNLMQVGRLFQMLLFFLLTSAAFYLVGLFQHLIVVENAWLTGFSVLAGTLVLGALTGAFRSPIRRTWLPVPLKRKP